MGDSDINNYPSTTVRNYPKKIAFLIDCDGGLGTAFHPKRPTVIEPKLIKNFPPNSDIFLFFNSNDPHIVKRMEEVKLKYPDSVHIFPTIIANSRNGADMNLSFILGAISNKYDKYIIIVRYDKAYEEIKERLEYTHPHLKKHVELQRFNGPKELTQYVRELNKSQEEGQNISELLCSPVKSATISPTIITFTSENLFRHCPLESWQESSRLYRFAEFLDHLNAKHPEIRYQYCSTCERMVLNSHSSNYQSQQFDKHFQEEHLNNNAGFCLSIYSN